MKLRNLVFLASLSIFTASCTKNSITGRSQILLVSESELMQLSNQQYKSFLSQHKVIPTGQQAEMVSRVGNRIATAITGYLKQKGQSDLLTGYDWEFRLVEDPSVNAWCMPGGKVVVYTGLMPVANDESGLAVVMGHEIAHAIARHGNERMSQGLMQQFGGVALSAAIATKPAATQDLFMAAYGVGSEVGGVLPFGRKQELEADRFGLIFAAIAGFDPNAAVPFWERMSKISGNGGKQPELLSTHPSDETRIAKVREYAKEASTYYKTSR
jgi:predicted Zn-dependent protease